MEVRSLTPGLGAEVRGIDLTALSEDAFAKLREAFLAHRVLVIRDQRLERGEQLAFARRFGEPEVHPIVEGTEEHPEVIRVHKPAGQPASFGVGWHTDNTFFARPSLGTVLYAEIVPPVGGDTLFADLEAAWEALSPALRQRLEGLRAVHSARRAYDPALVGSAKYEGKAPLRYRYSEAVEAEVVHPLVRTHPETGRRCLFVNPMFTTHIEGFHPAESAALLKLLFAHVPAPERICRVRWEPGTVTMWDNRCVWHDALDDYHDHERLMYRVTIAGDAPR